MRMAVSAVHTSVALPPLELPRTQVERRLMKEDTKKERGVAEKKGAREVYLVDDSIVQIQEDIVFFAVLLIGV
jgi:hypothetical protein